MNPRYLIEASFLCKHLELNWSWLLLEVQVQAGTLTGPFHRWGLVNKVAGSTPREHQGWCKAICFTAVERKAGGRRLLGGDLVDFWNQ